MTMDDQHLDGNGIAGLLTGIARADLTTVVRTCQSCGDRRAVGEQLAYRSAGVVLRCPNCTDLALVVGMADARLVVEWHGIFEMGRNEE
jgi:predicted RNA-binding Zn-ribbon protein involved in translation (DUF1610 family)